MRLLSFLLFLVLLLPTNAATYYICYETGNDANDGLSTNTPWKNFPYTVRGAFTGTHTKAHGNTFIFRRGVTWPNSTLPWNISHTSTIKTDPNWTKDGGTRAILDCEEQTMGGKQRENVVVVAKAAKNTLIADIELKRMLYTNPNDDSYSDNWGFYGEDKVGTVVSNVFIHSWKIATSTDSRFGGIYGFRNVKNCIIQGPTPGTIPLEFTDMGQPENHTAGAGIMDSDIVENNEIYWTTQGIWNCTIVRYNVVRDGGKSYNGPTHENGVWNQNDAWFYGNRIMNWNGMGTYFLVGWGGRNPRMAVAFGNIWYRTAEVSLSPQQNIDGNENEIWFFNNMLIGGSRLTVGTDKEGAPFHRLVIHNNILVRDSGALTINDSADLGEQYTNTHNLFLGDTSGKWLGTGNTVLNVGSTGEWLAERGMTTNNWYKPVSAVPEFLDLGLNLNGVFPIKTIVGRVDTDHEGAIRDAAWDLGMWEWLGGASEPDPDPTPTPTPPSLTIGSPANNHITESDMITVSGTVTAGSTVTVNGSAATMLTSTSWARGHIPLNVGSNLITAVATKDSLTTTKSITVWREAEPPNPEPEPPPVEVTPAPSGTGKKKGILKRLIGF
jgi:hypothetical protein